MSDVKRFSLRLSGELHAALVREAERERRSVHSLVLLILEERFGGKPVKREEAPRKVSRESGGSEAASKVEKSSEASVESPFSKGAQIKRSRGKGKK